MAGFTVTGPDVDRGAESASSGLSIAVTYASRASRSLLEASYYVRDAAGDVVGRADADGSGSVTVLGEGALAAYRVRQTNSSPPLDRAPTREEPPSSRADGRPGTTRRPSKEEKKMGADQKTRSSRSGPRAAAKTAPAAAAPKKGEKGVDLLAVLMQQVETQVAGVKRSPNKSETYTRLQTAAGKTFAYIFPPRQTGLAVKIPKQLLEVEESLPKGHGFHRTKYGLTRTITKASEAPSVVKAFAVAASAVSATEQEEGGDS